MAPICPLPIPFWAPHSMLLWLFAGRDERGPSHKCPHSWSFSRGLGSIGGSLA